MAAALASAAALVGILPAKASFVTFQGQDKTGEQLFLDTEQKGFTDVTTTVGHSGGPAIDLLSTVADDVSAGFATIKPFCSGHPSVCDTLTDLTFTPADSLAFGDFSFRAQLLTDSDITLKVTDGQGNPAQTFDLGAIFGPFKANQDLTRMGIISLDGETIKSVEITDASGFKEVKQIQFSPAGATTVPLPPAIALFGSGLIGLGLLSRRRQKREVAPIA
jgi:hypothetical protein